MTKYRLKDYHYNLPPELIAQEPLAERDNSRMLLLKKNEGRAHTKFDKLPEYLSEGDLLIFNNSKVIPARIVGQISGSTVKCECLLVRKIDDYCWLSMVKPGKKLKPGTKIEVTHSVQAVVEAYAEKGLRMLRFITEEPSDTLLSRIGAIPLPPYITNNNLSFEQYQTIFASVEGSAAAPTAGFHFTSAMFNKLAEKRVDKAFLTLHVGPGTFQPVKTDDIRQHEMHSEFYSLDEITAEKLNKTKKNGGRIVAIGTTSCRVLETAIYPDGYFEPSEGWSNLFIYPGYKFKAVNALLTNFHLPESTLLMLVSAMAGHKEVMEAYHDAVKERYRFFSFGDCMLIL